MVLNRFFHITQSFIHQYKYTNLAPTDSYAYFSFCGIILYLRADIRSLFSFHNSLDIETRQHKSLQVKAKCLRLDRRGKGFVLNLYIDSASLGVKPSNASVIMYSFNINESLTAHFNLAPFNNFSCDDR